MNKLGNLVQELRTRLPFTVRLKHLEIEYDIDQGITTRNGPCGTLTRLVNLERFGPTVQAFNGCALLIEPFIGIGLTVQPPAENVNRLNIHFTDGLTSRTVETFDKLPVFNRSRLGLH